jgi:hypothetical protein
VSAVERLVDGEGEQSEVASLLTAITARQTSPEPHSARCNGYPGIICTTAFGPDNNFFRRAFNWLAFAAAYSAAPEVVDDTEGWGLPSDPVWQAAWRAERHQQAQLIREIIGNPFHPVAFLPEWRTDTAVALARTMYEAREFSALPILADALQDAGCTNEEVLNHCREPGEHARGCWVLDLVLALQNQ